MNWFVNAFIDLDLLNITAAPNNGTYSSLHHTLNAEFLKHLSMKGIEEEHQLSPRYFPNDFDAALSECEDCKCPYCAVRFGDKRWN